MNQYRIADPYLENRLDDYFMLRWKVLRAPWDQPRGTERDDLEESSLHRMIILNSGEIVACGRLQLNGPREAQ
ncbi:MAG: GNAT family N-acetyltransferase, partial [Bacteroidia bacterium]|nr:GNAT family N-acetyltransferase [Bacteroidia bacterium]